MILCADEMLESLPTLDEARLEDHGNGTLRQIKDDLQRLRWDIRGIFITVSRQSRNLVGEPQSSDSDKLPTLWCSLQCRIELVLKSLLSYYELKANFAESFHMNIIKAFDSNKNPFNAILGYEIVWDDTEMKNILATMASKIKVRTESDKSCYASHRAYIRLSERIRTDSMPVEIYIDPSLSQEEQALIRRKRKTPNQKLLEDMALPLETSFPRQRDILVAIEDVRSSSLPAQEGLVAAKAKREADIVAYGAVSDRRIFELKVATAKLEVEFQKALREKEEADVSAYQSKVVATRWIDKSLLEKVEKNGTQKELKLALQQQDAIKKERDDALETLSKRGEVDVQTLLTQDAALRHPEEVTDNLDHIEAAKAKSQNHFGNRDRTESVANSSTLARLRSMKTNLESDFSTFEAASERHIAELQAANAATEARYQSALKEGDEAITNMYVSQSKAGELEDDILVVLRDGVMCSNYGATTYESSYIYMCMSHTEV